MVGSPAGERALLVPLPSCSNRRPPLVSPTHPSLATNPNSTDLTLKMALDVKPVSGLLSRYRQTGGAVRKTVYLYIQSEVQTKAGNAVIEWSVIAVIEFRPASVFFSACALLVFATSHQRLKVGKGADVIVPMYDFNFCDGTQPFGF